MNGSFIIHKKTNGWNILLLLCGISFIALYIFLGIVDSEATSEILVFLIAGILLCTASVFSMRLNHRAYLRIGEDRVSARYHWFGRLDCHMDEIEFVLPEINTVTFLLKNGKRHTIMGVANSWQVSSAVRRKNFKPETKSPYAILQQLSQLQTTRKKEVRWVLGGTALMFAIIFIAVLLTGGRDLHEFSEIDWMIFAGMIIIELLTVTGLFILAGRCGKLRLPIEQAKYRLRGALIVSHPMPTNNTRAVYTDENYERRVILCGFPNDESLYYCVQELTGSMEFETRYTSGIYDSRNELPESEFLPLIDITDSVLPD